MNIEKFRKLVKQELPDLVNDDPELQELIIRLSRREFASRVATEDRFNKVLDELRRDREAQSRKWDEQNRKWDGQNCKWDEHKREFDRVHEEIMAIAKKHDRSIGALGARWGMQTEGAFRNALAGILEESFGVQVIGVTEFDDEGEVFGRPDQIELDVIIKNGLLILCEIKSSIDKAGMYIFERKVRFYEKKHERVANRMMVISPMIDARAKKVAEKLGIEIYSYPEEVKAE